MSAGVYGGVIQCLACGATNKMLLMDVVRDDTVKGAGLRAPNLHVFGCRHIARQLVFSRAKMPTTHLRVIAVPIDKLCKQRVVAPRVWGNAVEKLRSRQIDLKESSSEDCWLDEGGRKGPQQTGGSCGTGSSRERSKTC